MKFTPGQIGAAIVTMFSTVGAIIVGVYLGIHMGRFETYNACSEKGTITYPSSVLLDDKARTIDCSTTPKHYGISMRRFQRGVG